MRLSKEEFVNAMNTFEDMRYQEDACIDVFDISPEWVPGTWITNYYDMIAALCDFTDEDYNVKWGSDLDYFIWKLDFGRNWTPGCVSYNGEEIILETPEQLYDFIVKRQRDKETR